MTSEYREIEPGMRTRVPVTRITHSDKKCVHSYYTMPVESADGQKIVFFEFDRPEVNRNDIATLTGQLTVANADGSNPETVARMKGSPAQGAMGQWVAATRRVAAVCSFDGYWLVTDTDTGQQWRGSERLREVSPDGKYIFCQTPEDIHMVAEESGKSVSEDEVAATIMNYETREIDVRISLADVLKVHPDAKQVRKQHMCFKQTLFSSNGRYISFVLSNSWYVQHRGTEELRHEIFLANRNGQSIRYLGPFVTHPCWHPSGDYFLAVAKDSSNTSRFMLYPADGSEPRALGTDWLGDGHPSIQPVHHRYLSADFYDYGKSVATLKLFDLEKGTVEDILQAEFRDYTNESGTHLHPAWSRDGTSLYIASAHLGHAQIYRVDLNE